MNTKKLAIGLFVIVAVLASAVAVSAAGVIPDDCVDAVTVGDSIVCFMGKEDHANKTTTWTYGVMRISGESGGAMSHVTFSICVDDPDALTPSNGDTYTTPATYGDFMGRSGINYNVVVGFDPTTGVEGIKFEDGVPEQTAGEVDIFQFTQPTQMNPGYEKTPFGLKDGNGGYGYPNEIMGPICGSSVVELTSFQAQSMSLFSRLLAWLGLR